LQNLSPYHLPLLPQCRVTAFCELKVPVRDEYLYKYMNTARPLCMNISEFIQQYMNVAGVPVLAQICNYKMNFICNIFARKLDWTLGQPKTMATPVVKGGGPLLEPATEVTFLVLNQPTILCSV